MNNSFFVHNKQSQNITSRKENWKHELRVNKFSVRHDRPHISGNLDNSYSEWETNPLMLWVTHFCGEEEEGTMLHILSMPRANL